MLNKFILEMKIDRNLNELQKYVENVFNSINENANDVEDNSLIETIDDIEFIIKNTKELLYLLEEEYENEISQLQR